MRSYIKMEEHQTNPRTILTQPTISRETHTHTHTLDTPIHLYTPKHINVNSKYFITQIQMSDTI